MNDDEKSERRATAKMLRDCARFMQPLVKVQFYRQDKAFGVRGSKSRLFDPKRFAEVPDRQTRKWTAQAARLIAAYDRECSAKGPAA